MDTVIEVANKAWGRDMIRVSAAGGCQGRLRRGGDPSVES